MSWSSLPAEQVGCRSSGFNKSVCCQDREERGEGNHFLEAAEPTENQEPSSGKEFNSVGVFL